MYLEQSLGRLLLGLEPPEVPQVYLFWALFQPQLGFLLQSMFILVPEEPLLEQYSFITPWQQPVVGMPLHFILGGPPPPSPGGGGGLPSPGGGCVPPSLAPGM